MNISNNDNDGLLVQTGGRIVRRRSGRGGAVEHPVVFSSRSPFTLRKIWAGKRVHQTGTDIMHVDGRHVTALLSLLWLVIVVIGLLQTVVVSMLLRYAHHQIFVFIGEYVEKRKTRDRETRRSEVVCRSAARESLRDNGQTPFSYLLYQKWPEIPYRKSGNEYYKGGLRPKIKGVTEAECYKSNPFQFNAIKYLWCL